VLSGSISGVTSFGIFVVMDEPFVEGLVRTDYLAPDDFYDFDEVACRLIGRRSGKQFSLGDRVEVEILQVSVARRRIELRLRDGSSQKGDRSQRQDRKDDRKDDRKGKPKVRAPKKADRNERRQKIRNQNTKRPKARR
jgi:ribonuclease R